MKSLKTWIKSWWPVSRKKLIDARSEAIKARAEAAAFFEEFEQLKALKIQHPPQEATRELCRRKGHIYYEFEQLTDIPKVRQIKIQNEIARFEIGMTSDYYRETIEDLETAWNKGNQVVVARCIIKLIDAKDHGWSNEALRNIAALIIMRDDENPQVINKKIHREKVAFFQATDDDFFLTTAYLNIMRLYTDSGELSPDGLKAVEQMIQLDRDFTSASEK